MSAPPLRLLLVAGIGGVTIELAVELTVELTIELYKDAALRRMRLPLRPGITADRHD